MHDLVKYQDRKKMKPICRTCQYLLCQIYNARVDKNVIRSIILCIQDAITSDHKFRKSVRRRICKEHVFSWCCPLVCIELRCLLVMANDSFFQALCCSDRRVHKINIVNTKCSSRPMPRNVQWKEQWKDHCSRPPTCNIVPHSLSLLCCGLIFSDY